MVVVIEETKDVEEIELEALQHSFEAHDYPMNERRQNHEQAFQARVVEKGKSSNQKGKNGKCAG